MTEKNIPFFKPAGQEGDYVERNLIALWLRAYRSNKCITITSANSDKTKVYVITIGKEFDLFATIIIR
jgi:hypothetical protein